MMETLMCRFVAWLLVRMMPVGGGSVWDSEPGPDSRT
jgi:hypothetical protein